MARKAPPKITPPAPQPAAPTRAELLNAQCGALTTQLGTIMFNYLEQRDSLRTQIRNIMMELKVLQQAEPKE